MWAKRSARLIVETLTNFMAEGGPTVAAAMGFHALFSLAPLFFLALNIASMFVEPSVANEAIETILRDWLGAKGGQQALGMIEAAKTHLRTQNGLAVWVAVASLIVGASGLFTQIQHALNRTWNVKSAPGIRIKEFAKRRLIALCMILLFGILMVISLIFSAITSAFSDLVTRMWPEFPQATVHIAYALMIWTMMTLVIGALFFFTPDTDVAWTHALLGATVTSALFIISKYTMTFVLGLGGWLSLQGAAGAIAVVLFWVYVSAAVFLLGAEFTQVYCRHSKT